ncbi:class I SAM-dependent methyltransferase (plasmid) [Sphingomonas sp. CL5.1]|uniref:class I SAM-dependent methyltransferase n=1 Tax=Sphingomonas sp. CL5.1 TaxID=2653203 RepID=UPI0015834821|nr:class I SAM-dependent methyltransferase [Sphingomonas sp. CL5.1]QKS02333.1 class I SAM-dependent methyltransferase [Sphingomonas sp. CL5.1]
MALTDPQDAVDYYDQDASAFARRYDSVTFDSVHAGLTDLLPAAGAAVLDVGAGSGRDARALAALGFRVTAVEPSAAFRQMACTDGRIEWVDDRLPDLSSLCAKDQCFAFILCSAVLMLVPRHELAPSFATMARLLEAGGMLAINLRNPVGGEPAELVHAHSDNDILTAADDAGLSLFRQNFASDALGRLEHRWRTFVFSRRTPSAP